MLAQVDAANGLARDYADPGADDGPAVREYRIGELARETGITVRTLRYYQERKLLPPPRRAGRIGWYSQAHVIRLRIIGQLLDRGHTLGGIGELLSAWEQGYDLAALLGLEQAITAPWSDEIPAPVTVADVSALLNGQLTPEILTEAVRLGYIGVEGDRVIHVSRQLLDATTILVREGIPLAAILDAGGELQAGLDKLAVLFVELVSSHVLGRSSAPPGADEIARFAEAIERLRPVARTVIDVEFARAMDRRAGVAYREFIRLLAVRDRRAGPGAAGPPAASGSPGRDVAAR
jgi:DNA-binding transcriptional MerR regulator